MSVKESNSSRSVLTFNLQHIFADEEDDNIVYSIREEIIENALERIDKISQESRMVQLVTECACEALRKLISIHFYYHVETISLDDREWVPDKPIAPSLPDTWATKNVHVQPKPVIQETKDEEICTPLAAALPCTCDLGVKCLCHLSSEEKIKDQVEILFTPDIKKTRRSTEISKQPSVDYDLDSNASLDIPFSALASDKESVACILREGFSKIGLSTPPLKLPKIEFPVPTFRASQTNVLELPPIRIAATFQAIPQEPSQDKQQKKEKKKKKSGKKK